tara:strand:+ start:678 stop:1319 length:642 start_codon:yes stop_codon:yes gene_type:complete
MPNWCNNNITITGPNKVIDKIEKIAKDEKGETKGLLNFFRPMPKELEGTTADGTKRKKLRKLYGHDDWYGWCVANWSTKWEVNEFYNVDRQEIGEDESQISFGFDSAWAPPINAYEYWIDENSNCSIKATYHEPGCDFMGIWDNGNDICYEISSFAPKGSKDKAWTHGDGKILDDLYGISEYQAEWEEQQKNEDAVKVKEFVVDKKKMNMEGA